MMQWWLKCLDFPSDISCHCGFITHHVLGILHETLNPSQSPLPCHLSYKKVGKQMGDCCFALYSWILKERITLSVGIISFKVRNFLFIQYVTPRIRSPFKANFTETTSAAAQAYVCQVLPYSQGKKRSHCLENTK